MKNTYRKDGYVILIHKGSLYLKGFGENNFMYTTLSLDEAWFMDTRAEADANLDRMEVGSEILEVSIIVSMCSVAS